MGNEVLQIMTPLGMIQIKMRFDAAPKTCERIEMLVRGGMYNGCTFYRAEEGFLIQGGLRTPDGKPRPCPFPRLPLEYKLENKKGTVTLARWQDENSGTSEFFINLKDNPHLDLNPSKPEGFGKGFTVWGDVVQGLEVAQKISSRPVTEKEGLKMLDQPVMME